MTQVTWTMYVKVCNCSISRHFNLSAGFSLLKLSQSNSISDTKNRPDSTIGVMVTVWNLKIAYKINSILNHENKKNNDFFFDLFWSPDNITVTSWQATSRVPLVKLVTLGQFERHSLRWTDSGGLYTSSCGIPMKLLSGTPL